MARLYIAVATFGAFAANVAGGITVVGDIDLYLGQSLTFLVLLLAGWRSALPVAVGAVAGLFWSTQGALLPLLTVAETALIAILAQRRVPLTITAVLFWLAAGIPAHYLLVPGQDATATEFLSIFSIFAALNGLLNASLATTAYPLLLGTFGRPLRHRLRETGVFGQTFSTLLPLVILPALCISLLLVNRAVIILGDEVFGRLQRHALDYAALTEMYLQQHQSAIELLAERHPRGPGPALYADLQQVQEQHGGFLTMLVADAAGTVINGAPWKRFEVVLSLDPSARNVADRGYFQRARDSRMPVISNGFTGRGFGSDPLVTVSTPLLDSSGHFLGIVEGSLNLPRFGRIGAARGVQEIMLILDASGGIVAAPDDKADESVSFPLLSNPRFVEQIEKSIVDVPRVTYSNRQFYRASATLHNGWSAQALLPVSVVAGAVEQFLVTFGIGILALVALAGISGHRFASSITRPLKTISKQLRESQGRNLDLPLSQQSSREIVQIYQSLLHASELASRFQSRLRQEVENKTRELLQANQALEMLTLEDPLTGINNRRGFALQFHTKLNIACREKLSLTVAMLDIDFFKQINDRFGHGAGDHCLRAFAKELGSTFRRRGDLIARIGGEEFGVVTIAEDAAAQCQRLEDFRRRIENLHPDQTPADLSLTVSIDVVSGQPEPGVELEDLLSAADAALYESKRSGRNRVTQAELPG